MQNPLPTASLPFGQLLRQLRIEAMFTQEDLAHSAGVSPRSVSDIERGITLTARKDTARLLADALRLDGPEREGFLLAARGRASVPAASNTLPRDVAFVGRDAQLRDVLRDAASGGVFAIGGMAGTGKTALAVHIAHRLAPQFPDGQVFLQLHAHTPGQQPLDPADALASLLHALGVQVQQIPHNVAARITMWRSRTADRKILILLDDVLDSEQVRGLLPGAPGCLVLITSRRRLTALDGASTISLDALLAQDAVSLFVGLADRGDIEAGDPAVTEIAELCGCLPLALGILARRLHHHQAWSAADLATDMRAARERLKLMQAEDLSVAAAFDLSYRDLTAAQQRIFRRLGLHPGTDFDAYAAAALDDVGIDAASQLLDDLYDQYLLTEPVKGRYRFHDLIREYAHTAAEADRPAERIAAADRVLDYYLHMARIADGHLGRGVPDVTFAPPKHMPKLAGSQDAIAWMEAERVNLHATAQYAAGRERRTQAAAIPAAMHEFLRRQGHWRQALTLESLAVEAARHGDGQMSEAKARADLADVQFLLDDYPGADANLRQALDLYASLGNRLGEANVLTQIGAIQHAAGEPAGAIAQLSEALKLYRGIGSRLGEANALTKLAAVQESVGDLGAAGAGLTKALMLYQTLGEQVGEADALIQLGSVQYLQGRAVAAAESVSAALTLYRDLRDRPGEARALNGLGELAFAAGLLGQARDDHEKALAIAQTMTTREEARALEGLGRCDVSDSQPVRGAELLRQALAIYDQMRYPPNQRVDKLVADLGRLDQENGRSPDAVS